MRATARFHNMFNLLIFITFVLAATPIFAADPVVPERRLAITQNMDFYGADLDPVFETSFDTCERICLANQDCRAFTFNFKSNACFPKTDISERVPFQGAASAQVFDTDPDVMRAEAARLAAMAFLPPYMIDEARKQARTLARDFITNQWTAPELQEAALNAAQAGNFISAVRFTGAALNLTDAADGWVELARLSLLVKGKDSAETRKYRQIASAAALNGYLRGQNRAVQISALNTLARAVELRGDGRMSIRILRASLAIAPRIDTEDALERAISLFGFRVTEHKVDNNAASPRICAEFSEALARTGVDYANYVQLPRADLVVEASGRQLCIEGLTHGETYRLTLRAGLPAESGEKLIKPVDLTVYVKDRDPEARFIGRAYVLPKDAAASIPIVTVNLSEIELKIHRVDERNLVRAIRQSYFGNPLSVWDEAELKASLGEAVWAGTGLVKGAVNQEVTTALPIGEAVQAFQPGVYVLSARDPSADPYDGNAAAQWFIVTDLGATTLKGGDGVHVFVRSLNTAEAKPGVSVALVARNNTVLGRVTTDAEGYAHIPAGLTKGRDGNAPTLLTLEDADQDFAFLSLKDAAFDLSDRGVAGRVSPPPMDVFLTTDRGAYRAGETVFATALLRDTRAEAISGLPLTAVIIRPDGVEYARRVLNDEGAGGRVMVLPLPGSAQRGTWNIRIHADPDEAALAATKFLVEDLVPERIDFDLKLAADPVPAGQKPIVELDAKYLYGAPGADLAIEAELRVSATDGLDAYPGFTFGRHDEVFGNRLQYTTPETTTDAKGHARFAMGLPAIGETSRLLNLTAIVRLKEGSGRPVERKVTGAMAPDKTTIGIRKLFEDVVPEGSSAEFEVIAVDTALKQTGLSNVAWTLNRVRTRYQWYQSYGAWSYEPITTRTKIASGMVDLDANGRARIDAGVDWGQYELRLETTSGEVLSASTDFWAGWYAPATSLETPDVLEIGLDKESYKPGDMAEVRLVPRYDGTALISVVSNRLIDMKAVKVTAGENRIALPVTEDWGAGAYVTASVIRPMDRAAGHNPARALGLNYAAVDPGAHRLTARFTGGNEVSPRATMTANLQVDGIQPGEEAYATIAAVDVGILNLTGFTAPDPEGHYFGQRRLGMEIRDLYGRLIDGMQGTRGAIRSGGDGPAQEGLKAPPPTEELVAYFSGPIKVSADGRLSVEFDIPEFNGTIRLMAVVWSKTGVGNAEKDVLARDPVVMTASLPRFLAPGDETRMLIELAHAKGPAGRVGLQIAANGGLTAKTRLLPAFVNLTEGGRATLSVPLIAPEHGGDTAIEVVVTTPSGQKLTKSLALPIRALDPEVARTQRVALADGDIFTLSDDVFADYLPGTGRATLAVGPLARFDAPGLLAALDRYPYGCTEQITSKALPLLYFAPVARAMGLSNQQNVDTRIVQAIGEVLSNQSSAGSFGLWRPGSGDLWLDAYVSDFLSRARAKGFDVPAQAFRLAVENLRNKVNYAGDFEYGGQAIAYALMVLAREGAANIGDLRYYADAKAQNFATPLALAQLGAALAYYGDQTRADRMFRTAGERLDMDANLPVEQLLRVDYGTGLRDTAAVLALAVEAGSEALDQVALAARIAPENLTDRARSTQENMWSLMAANALIEDIDPGDFRINGAPADGPHVQVLNAQTDPGREVRIENNSGRDTITVLSTFGIPAFDEPAGGNGWSIDRFYFTMDGRPTTPDQVRQNDRIVVVLKVQPDRYAEARLMINDPLPAGFEIDNPNLVAAGDVGALDWLDLSAKATHTEFRSERFLAAIDWKSDKPLQLAYIVRAISPGVFRHPAASVEDMYRPDYRARTGVGRVEVVAE